MRGWIGDVAAALVAVTDLAVAFKYAIRLNDQEKEKETWPT
jgi:hypothetical protein